VNTRIVIINDLFVKANEDLDGAVKGKVLNFITKLQLDPTAKGLDLKPPKGAADKRVRTARVDDFWRAVLFELPNAGGFVLATVKPHDDAYQYAANVRLRINGATGVLELFDPAAIEKALRPTSEPPEGVVPRPEVPAKPLITGVTSAQLRDFGLSDEVAARVLEITDQAQFHTLCDALPELQGVALLDLLAGKPYETVYEDLFGLEDLGEIDTEDFEGALTRPGTRVQFAPATPEDLIAAFNGQLAAWRVWLHPLQRKLAYHDGWNGPFRVTGGAGTGKTVTALHRAHHLADRLAAGGSQGRVLVATYTRNLAEALAGQLAELRGGEAPRCVDVLNLDALASRTLRAANKGKPPNLVSDSAAVVKQAWELAADGSSWDDRFLAEEWLDVVLAQGITDQAGYLRAPRPGRGVALNRGKRVEVWNLISRAVTHLEVEEVLTFTQAASRAADVLAARPDLQYTHVVVDEAQDLHPAHWRLVRALVPEGPDDIFIVGDAHQRIYGKPLVLSRFGINTRGRSRRLTINYRTSEEILRWSVGVMGGEPVDDLDGSPETLLGARSAFTGPDPVIISARDRRDEGRQLTKQVKTWVDEEFQEESIGVLCPSNAEVDTAARALKSAGIPAVVVSGYATPATGSVQVMTMHRAKGLEFRCVAMTGLGPVKLASPRSAATEEEKLRLATERALIYVAGTRARERLTLLGVGDMSRFSLRA
jgi:hypothetical protein